MTQPANNYEHRTEYSFTICSYLKDRFFAIIITLAAIVITSFMISILGVNTTGCLAIAIFLLLMLVFALAIGFLRCRRFYLALNDVITSTESACYIPQLLEEPSFLEGRITYEALEEMARMSNKEVNTYREDLEAHRRFTELWIHEVKTPIAAMRLIVSKLHGTEPDAIRNELERTETAVERSLFYARATSPSMDYELKEISLLDAIRSALKKNANLLLEKGVNPSIQVKPETMVISDASWLVFALSQIISNSAKYGATTLSFSAEEFEPDTPHGKMILTVVDNGHGIPAKDVPRVFERGYVGDNGRGLSNATGMGLYFVAILSQKMGISTKLSSTEGVGTTIEFAFPHDRRMLTKWHLARTYFQKDGDTTLK